MPLLGTATTNTITKRMFIDERNPIYFALETSGNSTRDIRTTLYNLVNYGMLKYNMGTGEVTNMFPPLYAYIYISGYPTPFDVTKLFVQVGVSLNTEGQGKLNQTLGSQARHNIFIIGAKFYQHTHHMFEKLHGRYNPSAVIKCKEVVEKMSEFKFPKVAARDLCRCLIYRICNEVTW